jgi:hypothetical protein
MLTDLQKDVAKRYAQGILGEEVIREFDITSSIFTEWLTGKEFNDEIIYHLYTQPPFDREYIKRLYDKMFGED